MAHTRSPLVSTKSFHVRPSTSPRLLVAAASSLLSRGPCSPPPSFSLFLSFSLARSLSRPLALPAVPSLPEGHVLLVLVVAEPARLRDYSKLILTHYPGPPAQNGAPTSAPYVSTGTTKLSARARERESEYKYENSRARGHHPSHSFVTALLCTLCAASSWYARACDDSIKIYYRRASFLSESPPSS